MKTMPACTIWTSTEPTTAPKATADAAEKARAAQHRGGDHVELLADAKSLVQAADEAISMTPPSAAQPPQIT